MSTKIAFENGHKLRLRLFHISWKSRIFAEKQRENPLWKSLWKMWITICRKYYFAIYVNAWRGGKIGGKPEVFPEKRRIFVESAGKAGIRPDKGNPLS